MKNYLTKILHQQNLSVDETQEIAEQLIAGRIPEAQVGALLMGLAMKGETAEEIIGLVTALRSRMISVPGLTEALDTCGTGGDGAHTINVSTVSAFVCAAAGVKIAKHGNRAASSRCGSFDLLEALGIKVNLNAKQVKQLFLTTGITFLFAPNFHPAFKIIAPIRQSVGIRTIFNLLGPLINPAQVRYQLIGVASPGVAEKLGSALIKLGSKRIIMAHSDDGLDEASPAAATQVFEFTPESPIKKYSIQPAKQYALELIQGGTPEKNAIRTRKILAGNGTPAENEFVSLNAGLALYAAGTGTTPAENQERARQILLSGQGFAILEKVVAVSQTL